MAYSCCDFTDDILDALNVDVPDESCDSPSDQADLALAEIDRLRRKAATYEAAIQAVKRCASGEMERPLCERSAWPDALQKLEAAIKHAS